MAFILGHIDSLCIIFNNNALWTIEFINSNLNMLYTSLSNYKGGRYMVLEENMNMELYAYKLKRRFILNTVCA